MGFLFCYGLLLTAYCTGQTVPFEVFILKNPLPRTSLVAQWLRICLPMQGTRVQALVWEDPTYRGAAKPVRHNY